MKPRELEWPEPGLPDYSEYVIREAVNDLVSYYAAKGYDRDALRRHFTKIPEDCRVRLENAA